MEDVYKRQVMPDAHWDAKLAHSDEYLAVSSDYAKAHVPLRDRFVPNGQMWVTESGDAGGGGDTWASTYLDVLRTLNELGSFCEITDGVIFHNTLASSDYGFGEHGSFRPRPNYFAILLWNQLMGTAVYDCAPLKREAGHVCCHSRKDGKPGVVYLVINNSLTDAVPVELPEEAQRYITKNEEKKLDVPTEQQIHECDGSTGTHGAVSYTHLNAERDFGLYAGFLCWKGEQRGS